MIPFLFGVFQGCSSTQPAATIPTHAARHAWDGAPGDAPWPVVLAAWRDVAAAVNWAGANDGFAVTSVEDRSPTARTFELVTIRGGSGTIRFTATRLVEGALPSDGWVSFEVDLGQTGDDARRDAIRTDLLRYRPKHAR